MESSQFNILSRDRSVTIDGFRIGDSIYCTLLYEYTARNYILEFIITYTLSVHSHVFTAIAL
jgi:hypothetical protein